MKPKKTTKTRFECSELVCDLWKEDRDVDYKKHFKDHGFIFNKQTGELYKDFDRAIFLNEGDRVDLIPFCSFQKVTWKYYFIDEDMMVYFLEQE
jgi:hypothetical protein